MAVSRNALVALSLLFALSSAPCLGTDAGHCLSRGFTPNLMCSSCGELKQFGLQTLEDECRSCCQEDGAASEEKVDQPFVKGEQPEQFPTLQVRYKKGANPTLKLLDDTNTVQDTLAIDRWDTDTVVEFLTEKLL